MSIASRVTSLYQRASAVGMFDAPYRPLTPTAYRDFAAIRDEARTLLARVPSTLSPYYDLLYRLVYNRPAPLTR